MQIEMGYKPSQTLAKLTLNQNEKVHVETGAMVGMSTNLKLETSTGGGVLKGLKRMFSGESFFKNSYTAEGGSGELLLGAPFCGDMVVLDLQPGQSYCISNTAFVASSHEVEVETKLSGFKGFFSGAGLFIMKVIQKSSSQSGQVIASAFGAIEMMECNGKMVIDTGHLIAWDSALTYQVGKSGSGWIASFFSGEGLVCHFSGQGRIWIQTRNPTEYGRSLGSRMPPRNN